MLMAASLALALTPRLKMADQEQKIDLETMIPRLFGKWRQQDALESLVISPDLKNELDRIYSQTLTRNYINDQGERVMLSIAYGSDQSYSTQVHRPEICYPGQGFQIRGMSKGFIDLGEGTLPVMKLVAIHDLRVEPITYWVMMGDLPVRGNVEQQFARVKYGLTGKIPYGLVIRVSIISPNEPQAYRTEERFIRDMLGAVPREYRKFLIGTD